LSSWTRLSYAKKDTNFAKLVAIISVSASDLEYTSEGMERLALVLRCFAKLKGWSNRQFAKECQLNASTVTRYMNGQVMKLKPETLQALARVLYRVTQIQGDVVSFDNQQTYGEDWLALAKIASDDPGITVS
jgi:DNA-binding Xre family transcriptional regulator